MPTPKFFEKIVELAHEDGVKFTFDCQVKGCNGLVRWEQDITHQEHGKMTLALCDKHMKDFDKNIPFEVEMRKNE